MLQCVHIITLAGNLPAIMSYCCVPGVDVLIIMVANDMQAESTLFGDGGSVSGIRHEYTADVITIV